MTTSQFIPNVFIEKNEANLPEDMKYIKRIPLTNLLTKSKSQNALKLGHNAFIKQHKKEMKRNPNGAPRKERTHQNYAEAPKLVKAPKKPKKTAEHRRRNEYAQQQMSGINDVSESEARSIIANAGNKVVIMIVYSHSKKVRN